MIHFRLMVGSINLQIACFSLIKFENVSQKTNNLKLPSQKRNALD